MLLLEMMLLLLVLVMMQEVERVTVGSELGSQTFGVFGERRCSRGGGSASDSDGLLVERGEGRRASVCKCGGRGEQRQPAGASGGRGRHQCVHHATTEKTPESEDE